jgi:hypothetical protein
MNVGEVTKVVSTSLLEIFLGAFSNCLEQPVVPALVHGSVHLEINEILFRVGI